MCLHAQVDFDALLDILKPNGIDKAIAASSLAKVMGVPLEGVLQTCGPAKAAARLGGESHSHILCVYYTW